MSFRKIVFWAHLVAGLTIGAVILTMSVTGMMMAYEPQIIAAAERNIATVAPASGSTALGLEALAQKAAGTSPETPPSGFTFKNEPTAAVLVNFGRERAVFFDPYTGAALGEVSKLRGFLHEVEHLHRDLLIGQNGKKITGACSLAFLGLVLSGLYLWWPRKWTASALSAITVPSLQLRGKARNWNWHNAVGFWCALPLIVAILTGAIMSYQWANNLLYRATGNEPPPPRTTPGPRPPGASPAGERPPGDRTRGDRPRGERSSGGGFRTEGWDRLLARAVAQVPGWKSLTLRLAEGPGAPVAFMIDEGDGGTPHTRSQLTLDAATGEIAKWEPYSSYNLGRQLRMWTKFVHTGEALGLAGQTVAALAALGAAILVWTGFALSWKRFRNRAQNRPAERNVSGPSVPVEPKTVGVP
jgi:uncharacterized iron-regulated membrane protein